MSDSDKRDRQSDRRATGGTKGSRAIANRGIAHVREAERNVRAGNLVELIPDRSYRAIGLDIGKTAYSKLGIREDFKAIRRAQQNSPNSEIIIRGTTSPSVRSGPSDATLAFRRAQAAKALLVRQGVPANSIRIEQPSTARLDPNNLSPSQKASMRGASIEIVPRPKPIRPEPNFSDDSVLVERLPFWWRGPLAAEPIVAKDPFKRHSIAGTTVSRDDLVMVGQMLEEEQRTGTLNAAYFFAGVNGASKFSWGHHSGGGNVLLPLRSGHLVDIDWLNAVLSNGGISPLGAFAGYAIGKPLWAVADGLFGSDEQTKTKPAYDGPSWKRFTGHLRAYFSREESDAMAVAGTWEQSQWQFKDILHSDLVTAASKALSEERDSRSKRDR